MEKLADILEWSLERLPVRNRLEDYAIWPIWNETVGSVVARNAQPEKIRNGTLFIKVSAPTWMQQLQYMKDLIIAKLNERLGRQAVTGIFFTVGTLPAHVPEQAAPHSRARVDDSRLPEAELRSLRDPDLQQRLRSLMAAHLRRRSP